MFVGFHYLADEWQEEQRTTSMSMFCHLSKWNSVLQSIDNLELIFMDTKVIMKFKNSCPFVRSFVRSSQPDDKREGARLSWDDSREHGRIATRKRERGRRVK